MATKENPTRRRNRPCIALAVRKEVHMTAGPILVTSQAKRAADTQSRKACAIPIPPSPNAWPSVKIWLTLCNPDDEFEVDDEYCDWLGFTANVDWVASEDFDSVLAYKNWDDGEESQKTKKKTSSVKGNAKAKSRGGFKEGMCDPSNDIKPEHEDICEDVWFTMCNPDDETEVDDEYCDWLGFTADVEWYDVGEDLDYLEMKDLIYYEDSYDSSDDSEDRQ
eukprot:479590_1